MRKLMLGAAGAAFFALGGCATTDTGGVTIQEIQNAAVAACSFLPTASSVAVLLNANASIQTAEAVAKMICAAVASASTRTTPGATPRAAGPISVTATLPNGQQVTIRGSFVAGGKNSVPR